MRGPVFPSRRWVPLGFSRIEYYTLPVDRCTWEDHREVRGEPRGPLNNNFDRQIGGANISSEIVICVSRNLCRPLVGGESRAVYPWPRAPPPMPVAMEYLPAKGLRLFTPISISIRKNNYFQRATGQRQRNHEVKPEIRRFGRPPQVENYLSYWDMCRFAHTEQKDRSDFAKTLPRRNFSIAVLWNVSVTLQ